MTQNTDQERAEFEKWWQEHGLGGYESQLEAWQAARRAQVVHKCSECEDTGVGVSHGYDCTSCYGNTPESDHIPDVGKMVNSNNDGISEAHAIAKAAVHANLATYRRVIEKRAAPVQMPEPEKLARDFHDAYERLATSFGYETRK